MLSVVVQENTQQASETIPNGLERSSRKQTHASLANHKVCNLSSNRVCNSIYKT